MIDNRLKKINNWVFDLDDTLYPSNPELSIQMSEKICDYIQEVVHVDEETASLMQKSYYLNYGATVCGLVVEYHIDPHDFTRRIHDLDLSCLTPDPELREYMQKLKGSKYILTNGDHNYAVKVLRQLNLDDLVDGIFAIQQMGFIPKPSPLTYRKMLRTFDIDPRYAAMFDDNQKNIYGAKQAGMYAVWVASNDFNKSHGLVEDPNFCDSQTPDVVTFLKKMFDQK